MGGYLKNWWRTFKGGSRAIIEPPELAVSVESENAEESALRDRVKVVSIFINERRRIDKNEPITAKASNFLPKPNKTTGRVEKSSFCLEGLSEESAWACLETVSTARQVLGRAEFNVVDLYEHGLHIDANWVPERHVDIVGWPEVDDRQETERKQNLLAQTMVGLQTYIAR